MQKIKKLLTFQKEDISYKTVIIFSIIFGIIPAILKLLPFLNGTSFQDIAISYECWILLALIIILNSKSSKDAIIKTFIFFLISQPLIYLIQVPFYQDGFGIFRYYKPWFIQTLLVIPGSYIAYQIKRKNILSAIVLSIGTSFLFIIAMKYIFMSTIPYHLLSIIFCFIMGLYLIFILLSKKIHRFIAIGITIIATVIYILINVLYNTGSFISYPISDVNLISYKITNQKLAEISINEGDVNIQSHKNGKATIVFIDENGVKYKYRLEITKVSHQINFVEIK